MKLSEEFSVEITAEEGREDGLLSVVKAGENNRGVLAYVVPRCRYADALHQQDAADKALHSKLNRSGVYILWEPSGWGCRPKCYVGKSDSSVGERLLKHHNADMTFWKTAVVFTDRNPSECMNKTQLKQIEAGMHRRVRDAGRCLVTNANRPLYPRGGMHPRDERDAEGFTGEALSFLPFIGIDAFVAVSASKDVDALFKFVCQQITWLGREIVRPLEAPKDNRAPFKLKDGINNFVTVHKEADALRITLNIPRAELYDPHNIVKDNPDPKRRTAETMVIMASKADWPEIQPLIRQSFERLARS